MEDGNSVGGIHWVPSRVNRVKHHKRRRVVWFWSEEISTRAGEFSDSIGTGTGERGQEVIL